MYVCIRSTLFNQNELIGTGSLKAQRLLTAANVEVPDKVECLSRELWMRVWSRVSVHDSNNGAHYRNTHTHTHALAIPQLQEITSIPLKY